MNTPYVKSWEDDRREEIAKLTKKGIVPFAKDVEAGKASHAEGLVAAMGQAAGGVKDIPLQKK